MAIQKPIIVRPHDLLSLTTSSAAAGNPVSNLADFFAPGLTWRTSSPASIWARGQFDGTKSVNFCAMIAANALPGTQIRVRLGTTQAQVDGTAPYDSAAQTFISPATTRQNGFYNSHLEMGSTANASWWRIDITGHTGEFEAAAVVFGTMVRPARFYNWDYEYGVEDLGSGEFTPWGVFDEAPGLRFRKLAFTLGWQTQADFEASFRDLLEGGVRDIIYCCFDPEATTARQVKTYMGIFGKPPFARGTRKPGFAQDFSIISYI